MTDTIICTTVLQPHIYGRDVSTYAVAVSLNFACRASDHSPSQSEEDARKRFEDFLCALPDVKFRVFRYAGSESSPPGYLEPTEWTATEDNPPSIGARPDIADWLECWGEKNNLHDYWVSAAPPTASSPDSDYRTRVKVVDLQATHVLGAAAAWPAPLPQNAGLVRILTLMPTTASSPPASPPTLAFPDLSGLIIVPFFDQKSDFDPRDFSHIPYPGPDNSRDLIRFTYDAGQEFPNATAEVRFLDLNAMNATGLMDIDTGFLVAPTSSDHAENVVEVLKRIETRSASLFWTFPAIQSIKWNDASIHSPPTSAMARLVWRAMNGIATLLDPVVLSLVMPSPPTGSSPENRVPKPGGPFVSALAACVEDARRRWSSPEPKPSGIAEFVEANLRSFLSLDEIDIEQRRKLVARLNQLLGVFAPALGNDRGFFDASKPEATVKAAPNFLWLLMRCYAEFSPDGAAEAQSELLKAAVKRFGSGNKEATLETALNNELGALAQKMQADDGIEQLALNLLEGIGLLDNSGEALADALNVNAQHVAQPAIASFRVFLTRNFNALDAVRHAQARLYGLHLVTAAAKPKPRGGVVERWSGQDLMKVMREARWFARRIDPTVQGTFRKLGDVLPIYADSWLMDDDRKSLTDALTQEFWAVCNELYPSKNEQRFVPDHAPQSLQVQIAVDSDLDHLEDFAHAYSGLGVLVRRAGEDWAYTNLAELEVFKGRDTSPKENGYHKVPESGSPGPNLITVVPLQPSPIDDQISLFVPYNGLPSTSRAFIATRAAGSESESVALPFFKIDDPAVSDLKTAGFAPPPLLAYGEVYDIAAFVIGKDGALPRSVQALTAPWMPNPAPGVPPDVGGKTYARRYCCQRTTAIGRITLNEPGPTKRIGADIDRVQPLFRDYPRIGLSSAGGSSVLELLRNSDGTGAFRLPQVETSASAYSPPAYSPPQARKTGSLTLQDLWWWGGPGELTLSVFAKSAVDPIERAEVAWTFPISGAFADASLTLGVSQNDSTVTFTCLLPDSHAGPPAPSATQIIDADLFDGAEAIWLRLTITTSSSPAQAIAVSFADPAAADGRLTSRSAGDSVVLIAPDTPEWRAPYRGPVNATVIFQRIGFNDFDFWLNSRELAEEVIASNPGRAPTRSDKDRFDKFRRMLMIAYVARHLDPSLGPLIDSLPDLSVDQLLIELTPLDALSDAPADVVLKRMGSITQTVSLKTLGARLLSLPPPPGSDEVKVQDLVQGLAALSNDCMASLTIRSSDPGELSINIGRDGSISVTVPRGMVARLTIRPMVPQRYLEKPASPPDIAIFKEEMVTLATEKRGDHYVLEGASLVIESMLGGLASSQPRHWMDGIDPEGNRSYGWENLVAKAVAVRAAGANRSYDLIARPAQLKAEAFGWWWRQLANIDVETQRWRFTGRPIYSWLNPKKNAQGPASGVAIEQTWGDDDSGATMDAISRFEEEIFFDRDEADADVRSMQLSPAPHETVLQSFPWEPPSATYFRHRVTVRSRYEGALALGETAAQRAWGKDSDFKDDRWRKQRFGRSWIRVAMLADRTRLQLTRPQLRALIPLTVAPGTSEGKGLPATPPVMAILDERPFAHGGLADRIAAEIRTGLGYELPEAPAILQISDARKEFGPDSQLTYTPTPEDVARALTLRNEGPVGLTFDSDNVRAAVFANTALVLHPILLTSTPAPPASMEEHFGSVGLRRYLDPAWLAAEAANDHAIKNPLWIQWLITDPRRGFRLGVDGTAQSRDLIRVEEDHGVWTVWFDAALIDPLPQQDEIGSPPSSSPALSPAPNFKKLCAMYAGAIEGLAFLHLPLEKGRASLSVFAQTSATPAYLGDSAILAGDSNQPLMMGSIEWQVPVGSTHLWLGDDVTVSLTSASPTTLMNWTRTGRNFELWHATKDGDFGPYGMSNIAARWTDNKRQTCVFFDRSNPDKLLSFEPRSSRYPNPLYLHRHHAVIATKNALGLGRPVEIFTGVRRIFGGPFLPPSDTEAVRLVEFETPARPLAWLKNEALADFKTAHFDLVSIWGNYADNSGSPVTDPGFSLFIRPLGGDTTNQALTELALHLHVLIPQSTQPMDKKITLSLPQGPRSPARGIMLIVTNIGDQPEITGQVFYVGGGSAKAQVTIKENATSVDKSPAVELTTISLKAGGIAPAEFWTDVSLLILPRHGSAGDQMNNPAGMFTFDWFFTGGETQLPVDAVKEASLREMIEAQARIIAVSPSIPVERFEEAK
jgi:hypothetical protein